MARNPLVDAKVATLPAGVTLAGLVLLLAALVLAPAVLEGFQIFQLSTLLIMSIALLGLNLLVGYNGQLSLGHGAIYAIGAYSTAILIEHGGLPWWLALAAGSLVSLCFGLLFGWPALRLKGHHLALATFALALAMPQLLKHSSIEKWTGGVQGLMIFRPDPPGWLPLSGDQYIYAITLILALALFGGAWNLLQGRIGRAMVAVRENPVAAAAMGVNVARIKILTFGLSSFYTGLAGGLSALLVEFVSPDSFSLMLSVMLVIGIVAGGLATLSGAVIGAAFLQFVPSFAEQVSKAAPSLIYAAVLLAVVFFMPGGIAGLLRQILRRVIPGRKRAPASET